MPVAIIPTFTNCKASFQLHSRFSPNSDPFRYWPENDHNDITASLLKRAKAAGYKVSTLESVVVAHKLTCCPRPLSLLLILTF